MKKVTIKNSEVVSMKMAFDSIDNASSRPEKFVFPAKGIYWIGRTMRKVKSAFDDLETARVKIVERFLADQKASKPDSADNVLEGRWLAAFSKEYQQVLETEVELELPELKLSYLDLDKNSGLPVSVIRDLDPILVDDSPDDKVKDQEKKE